MIFACIEPLVRTPYEPGFEHRQKTPHTCTTCRYSTSKERGLESISTDNHILTSLHWALTSDGIPAKASFPLLRTPFLSSSSSSSSSSCSSYGRAILAALLCRLASQCFSCENLLTRESGHTNFMHHLSLSFVSVG